MKEETKNISNVKDRIEDEYASNPYIKQIRQGKSKKEYALSHFYGYIHNCLKRLSDMNVQSKRLTKLVFPQNSYSSSNPINCEMVSDNGCKWSKDVYEVRKSHSKMSDVIRISRKMVNEMMEKSTIVHDQANNIESTLYSSSSSITPCSEVCEIAILSVKDDGNES